MIKRQRLRLDSRLKLPGLRNARLKLALLKRLLRRESWLNTALESGLNAGLESRLRARLKSGLKPWLNSGLIGLSGLR